MTEHTGLPVHGYVPQAQSAVDQVNLNKINEEHLLRLIELLQDGEQCDGRWLAIAKTHFEQGYMALNRAIFKPQRVVLKE